MTLPNLLALITRLKQICNGVDSHSGKLDWLVDYLSIVEDEGDKALVFSQYVGTLDDIISPLTKFNPSTTRTPCRRASVIVRSNGFNTILRML